LRLHPLCPAKNVGHAQPGGEGVALRRFHQPERDGLGVSCSVRNHASQFPPQLLVGTKLPKRGPRGEEEKVRLAPAIRRAESCHGNGGSTERAYNASPLMLATTPIVRIPDPVETSMGSEVINVPMRSRRQPLMVREAGPDTSWPQGAAHVNVEASAKL
jgi:hypothetical protein